MIDKLDLNFEMVPLSNNEPRAMTSPDVSTRQTRRQGEAPATPERRVELDQELGRVEPEPGDGRFIIVASTAEAFELWLFDKQLQSDEMHKVEIPFGPGAVHEIAARVVAWQLQGVTL